MKRFVLFLIATALFTVSCSSDSDSNSGNNHGSQPSGEVLVKKVSITYEDEDEDETYTEVTEYVYNGSKLTKIVYPYNYEDRFTYTGDLITKMEYFEGNTSYGHTDFTYDSAGRLTKVAFNEDSYNRTKSFVYNNDGTVTCTTQTNSLIQTSTFHYENGEVVKIVHNGGLAENISYDGKNSPFRNITGFNKIAFAIQEYDLIFGSTQNVLQYSDATTNDIISSNTMTYNSQNYPTTLTYTTYYDFENYSETYKFTY